MHHCMTANHLFVSLKVVKILFKEKLGELSGNAQRSLFQVLERMIDTGQLISLSGLILRTARRSSFQP